MPSTEATAPYCYAWKTTYDLQLGVTVDIDHCRKCLKNGQGDKLMADIRYNNCPMLMVFGECCQQLKTLYFNLPFAGTHQRPKHNWLLSSLSNMVVKLVGIFYSFEHQVTICTFSKLIINLEVERWLKIRKVTFDAELSVKVVITHWHKVIILKWTHPQCPETQQKQRLNVLLYLCILSHHKSLDLPL